jgi:hypothetical protein
VIEVLINNQKIKGHFCRFFLKSKILVQRKIDLKCELIEKVGGGGEIKFLLKNTGISIPFRKFNSIFIQMFMISHKQIFQKYAFKKKRQIYV